MYEYLITFITSGIFGWFFEYFLSGCKLTQCADTVSKLTVGCIPFLTSWAIGGVLLLYFSKLDYNIYLLSLIAGITLIIMECIMGKLSLGINGVHTWNYKWQYLPMCDNYISLNMLVIWILMSFVSINLYKNLWKK